MTIFKLKNIIFCQQNKSLNKITWSKFKEKLNRHNSYLYNSIYIKYLVNIF